MSNINWPKYTSLPEYCDIFIVTNITKSHNNDIVIDFFNNINAKTIIHVPGDWDIHTVDNVSFTTRYFDIKQRRMPYEKLNISHVNVITNDLINVNNSVKTVSLYCQSNINNNVFKNTSLHKSVSGFAHRDNSSEITRQSIKPCDILVTSYPPYGISDKGYGCKHLYNVVLNIKPQYHLFRGFSRYYKVIYNDTTFINTNMLYNKKYTEIII